MNKNNQLPNLDSIFKDDEEVDFSFHSGGSNLAAIFGTPTNITAQAAKKPVHQVKPSNPPAPSSSVVWETLIAKAVHAFKLERGKYSSVGKVGIALAGNNSTKNYQIILYRTKQDYLSTVKITPDFSYTVQENKYCNFYDNNNDNWSILFEDVNSSVDFARNVGIARYFTKRASNDKNVVYQDLLLSEKSPVAKENDKISIKYSIINEVTTEIFKDKERLSSSKEIPDVKTVEISSDDSWERLLLDTSKGMKRLLFLPSSKQISLGPGYPKDRDVLLEIEIIEIHSHQEEQSSTNPTSSVSSGKASLISRMAKMGQTMLPKTSISTTTDSEDTEEDLPKKSPRHKRSNTAEALDAKKEVDSSSRNLPKILKSRTTEPPAVLDQTAIITQTPTAVAQWSPLQQQFINVNGQLYPLQQTIAQPLPASVDPNLNVLLAETRTQNTELRMGMAKISDNVQKLLDKFHEIELQNARTPSDKKTVEATLSMLLAAQSPSENNSREPPKELLDELTRTKEELSKISREKEDIVFKVDELMTENANLREKNKVLVAQVRQEEESKSSVQSELDKTRGELERVKNSTDELESERSTLKDKLVVALEATNGLKVSNDKEVRRIMNETYQTLSELFSEDSYDSDVIKQAIASTIKTITKRVLQEKNSPKPEIVDVPNIDEMPKIDSITQEEPPPIPPMDLDTENDWMP